MPTLPMSICTVSRYTSTTSQARIFQSTTQNWANGHGNGLTGVALASAWLTQTSASVVKPDTNWVIQCTSLPKGGVSAVTLVNGVQQTAAATSGFVAPDLIGINSGAYAGQASPFGAAELILWNRSLTPDELFQASLDLSIKYCVNISIPAPQPPQPPSPPAFSAPAYLLSPSNGTVAWYDFSGYSPSTGPSGAWIDKIGGYNATLLGVFPDADAENTAGSSCGVS